MTNRRGRPPGSEQLLEKARELMGLNTPETPVEYEVLDTGAEDLNPTEEVSSSPQISVQLESVAFGVVRNGDVYQLVRIPFNLDTLQAGQGEVIAENTDRWEIQGQFNFEADEAFLLKESL